MSLWGWFSRLFGSRIDQPGPPSAAPPEATDELLTGTVERVKADVVVLLDSGRAVHCPIDPTGSDAHAFRPGDRVVIERIEIEDGRSVGVGLRASSTELQPRHIPELDAPLRRKEPTPPSPAEQEKRKRAYKQRLAEDRVRATGQRREWLAERETDRDAALREASAELPAPVRARLAGARKPCLRLIALPTGKEGAESQLGGRPFLPEGTAWPRRDGRPLSFLAQLRLSELPQLETVLPQGPRRGRLLFFYDAEDQPWGLGPEDAGGTCVMLIGDEDDGALRDAPADLPEEGRFFPCTLAALCEPSLPSGFSDEIDAVLEAADDEMRETYWGIYESVDRAPCRHQLGGHPDIIQGPMEDECEAASRDANGGAGEVDSAPAREPEQATDDWTLLLQLDSDEAAPGWMWGDAGYLYVWIRRSDLAAGRFDRTWTILQCT